MKLIYSTDQRDLCYAVKMETKSLKYYQFLTLYLCKTYFQILCRCFGNSGFKQEEPQF